MQFGVAVSLQHSAKSKIFARIPLQPQCAHWDSFPMNAAGKVLKYKMRQDAAERLGLTGDGSNTAENPNG